jgi:hypothetical protein
MGAKKQADEHLRKALDIRLKKLGPNHPHTQITQSWLNLLKQLP